MVDFAFLLRAPDENRAFWRVCLFVDLFLEGMFFITARIADPWLNPAPILFRMLHSKRPKYQWATGHFIDHISPHSWGSCCVWEEYSALRALPPSGGEETESYPISDLVNIDIGFTSLTPGLLCNYNWSPLFWSSCTAWITLVVSRTAAPGTGNINVSKARWGAVLAGVQRSQSPLSFCSNCLFKFSI